MKNIFILATLVFLQSLQQESVAEDFRTVLKSLPASYAKQANSLAGKLQRFESDAEKLEDGLRSDLYSLLRNSQNANDANRKLIEDQVIAMKKWLEDRGALPESHALLPAVYDYATQIETLKSKHLEKLANSLYIKLKKDGLETEALNFCNAYSEVGGISSASSVLIAENRFGGTRWTNNSNDFQRIEFRIKNVHLNSVAGEVHRDMGYANHPIHAMAGEFKGTHIHFQTGATLRPGNKLDGAWNYTGIVVGRTIIGTYSGAGVKGNAGSGFFRVDQL